MGIPRCFFFLGLCAIAGPAFGGHCTNPPEVELRKPSPGVSIHRACYVDFGGYCQIDTFYQAALHAELAQRFQANSHAIFGIVDSIQSHLAADTQWFDSVNFYVDSTRREDVWITVLGQLKGFIPEQKLFFSVARLTYVRDNPLYFTYAGLIDTPFVAFFDTYATLAEMNIDYENGCFVEPSAYLVIQNGIEKKGQEGFRMPGISEPVRDLAQAIGLDPDTLRVPSVRQHDPRLRFNRSGLSISRGPEPRNFFLYDRNNDRSSYSRRLESQTVSLYDLGGRRLARFHTGDIPGNYAVDKRRFAGGFYLLRVSGTNWTHTRELFLSGSGVSDTVNFHR